MLSINLLATTILGFYASSINAADYETYPTVAHTASINGFADKIYNQLPDCAKPCVEEDTSITPCPYWDPGCLCVMSNWGGEVAECIAENCQGDNVITATSLANSVCSNAGVPSPYWYLPASASINLLSAAAATVTTTESSSAPATTDPTSSSLVTTDPFSSILTKNDSVSSTQAEESSSNEGETSSISSMPATKSDAKQSNIPIITSTPGATVANCPSCTRNMTNFSSIGSDDSIAIKASEIVTFSDPNEEYTSTSVAGYDSTQVEFSTTVITETSCESNKCSEILKTTVTLAMEERISYTTDCTLPTESESTVPTIVTSIFSCDNNTCKSIPTTISSAITSESNTLSDILKHESSHNTKSGINSAPAATANEFPLSSSATSISEKPSISNFEVTSTNNASSDIESSGSDPSGSLTISSVSAPNENSSSSITNAVETALFTPNVIEGIAPVNKQWGLSSFAALFAIALFLFL